MPKPKQKAQNPSSRFIPPEFFSDPEVPTSDFFEHRNLNNHSDLEELLGELIFEIENGYFLRWEAVIRKEHGVALAKAHKEALAELMSFNDDEDDDERILYIDEIPRPSESWYEIVRKIASHLVVKQFKTYESHFAVTTEGWPELVECLEEHASGLSLPEGAKSPIKVIPEETRHRLWLQYCFELLSGLGQQGVHSLEEPDEQYRIEEFIKRLRERKDSVQFLALTMEKLLAVLILPPNQQRIFVDLMLKRLEMSSAKDQLEEFL